MISDAGQINIKAMQEAAGKASRLLGALAKPDRLVSLCRLSQEAPAVIEVLHRLYCSDSTATGGDRK